MSKRNSYPFVGMLTLIWLGWGMTGIAAEPLPSLDELLKQYHALGLPLPPREAKLVQYEVEGGGVVNGKVQPKVYGLAFEVKTGTKTENPLPFTGVRTWESRWYPHEGVREVEPEPGAAKDVFLRPDVELVLAIQFYSRGWHKLARLLLERSRKQAELPARDQLIRLAWDYWEDHLTEPKIDRAPIGRRLKELIRQHKELDTEYHHALLKCLDLALVPSKAKPGSIEALIDDLVDYEGYERLGRDFEPEDRFWRIATLAFKAVPTLIEHLDDERLTRAIRAPNIPNPSPGHLFVGDIVSDLLGGLAGQELAYQYAGDKAAAQKWWDKARKVGEETYLLDHVLYVDPSVGSQPNVNRHILNVILVKYPKHIPGLYRKALEKYPEMKSDALARAVLRCKLTDKEKLDLLLPGAKHKYNGHRLAALWAIKVVDKKQFDSQLLAILESFPRDVPEPYWKCPEADVAELAFESDNPVVWQTMEKVARRSAVGLRMEFLSRCTSNYGHRLERLRLLASFLDDGARGWFPFDNVEVGDFVALQIAGMLGIPIKQDWERPPQEVAKIRRQIREAVKRELSNGK